MWVYQKGGSMTLANGLSNMRSLINDYKKSAKIRKIEYGLTEEQFLELTQEDCFYCGAKPYRIQKHKQCKGTYICNGIDRVDSKKGYTIDNVVSCCKICNYAKRTSTLQEFQNWIERVYSHFCLFNR